MPNLSVLGQSVFQDRPIRGRNKSSEKVKKDKGPKNVFLIQIKVKFRARSSLGNYLVICFASPDIIWVKVCNRLTDRQTNSLTPFTGMCGFFSVKFATSLSCLAHRRININFTNFVAKTTLELIDNAD